MNKLEEYFYDKPHKFPVHKWHHYFEIYDRHFSKYVGKQPSVLEVGIDAGGGLEMFNDYFGEGCRLYGVDSTHASNPRLEKELPNVVELTKGDQGNVEFWKEYKERIPKFDIIIDDGGHHMKQQITTFECMYDHVKDDGIYLCEDLHTSYWHRWGGGYKRSGTFIEYTKNFIDYIHAWHTADVADSHVSDIVFRKKTNSIHFYDSVVVLEKRADKEKPQVSRR